MGLDSRPEKEKPYLPLNTLDNAVRSLTLHSKDRPHATGPSTRRAK
jgi:hypothetical protein